MPSPVQVLTATATAADTRARMVGRSVKMVNVIGTVTDANDWITLPSLRTVEDGSIRTILNNAGSDFEMRTPVNSGELINNVDADGSNELLCTDTEIMTVTKITDTVGWSVHAHSAVGAAVAAVVPN